MLPRELPADVLENDNYMTEPLLEYVRVMAKLLCPENNDKELYCQRVTFAFTMRFLQFENNRDIKTVACEFCKDGDAETYTVRTLLSNRPYNFNADCFWYLVVFLVDYIGDQAVEMVPHEFSAEQRMMEIADEIMRHIKIEDKNGHKIPVLSSDAVETPISFYGKPLTPSTSYYIAQALYAYLYMPQLHVGDMFAFEHIFMYNDDEKIEFPEKQCQQQMFAEYIKAFLKEKNVASQKNNGDDVLIECLLAVTGMATKEWLKKPGDGKRKRNLHNSLKNIDEEKVKRLRKRKHTIYK